MGEMKRKTFDMVYIALFAVVMAVCAWIVIPMAVPFTLQTFGVFLAVGVLGGKKGTIAVFLYLLLGLIGLPVFSGFTGGVGVLFGPTGGYLIGFLVASLVMWGIEHLFGRGKKVFFLSMPAGLLCCYAFGTLWIVLLFGKSIGFVSATGVLLYCVAPYVIPDLIKIGLVMLVRRRLFPFVRME